MKYSKEERLNIGRRIYDGELTKYEAAERYGISINSARDYMRLYRDANHLPPRNVNSRCKTAGTPKYTKLQNWEDYKAMSKDQLILKLVNTRIIEAQLKKDAK